MGKVQVTLIHVTKDPEEETDVGVYGRESGHYFLPGADYHETIKTLLEAGFRFGSTEAALESRADKGERHGSE